MSLRDGVLPSKQSPVTRGDCFAKCARNDMQMASLRQRWSSKASVILGCIETQSATGEELRPFFGRTLLPSVPVLSLSKGWIGRLRENCRRI